MMTGRVLRAAPYKCGQGNHGYQADKDMGVIELDRDLKGVEPVPVECGL